MSVSPENILRKMEEAEREAAELVLHASKIMAEVKSGQCDVVTEYDRRVQALLIDRLSAAAPGATFFCEENGVQESTEAENAFVIDPIDGTMNFVRHMHSSCISAAFMQNGIITAAAVYNPYADEMFTALKGRGAWLNGREIRAENAPLRETVFCFGTSPYYPEYAEESFRAARIAFDNSLDLRRFGSAELDLCSIAAGRAGLYFELCLSFWDYAAGSLIVEEAGGICTGTDGRPLPLDGRKAGVIAGSKTAHADFMKIVRLRSE